jgi:Carboxypeptidase regulatory-like domain
MRGCRRQSCGLEDAYCTNKMGLPRETPCEMCSIPPDAIIAPQRPNLRLAHQFRAERLLTLVLHVREVLVELGWWNLIVSADLDFLAKMPLVGRCEMRCKLIAASFTLVLIAGSVLAQSVAADDPNHKPSVFLGGEKPKKNAPITSRSVKGIVLDTAGQPATGALVVIKDLKNLETWTFVTKADGKYHFEELSLVVDYELTAKKGTDISTVKRLSQYDHAPAATRNFELEKAPAAASAAATKDQKPTPKN